MLKKEIYPKTVRLKVAGAKCYVTEKIDGSNLCIFKKNGFLYIAQRKTIINIGTELDEYKDVLYKGLYQWIIDNIDDLNTIRDNSVVCGEVPTAYELQIIPTKEQLDGMYEKYSNKVGRNVEGFVINYNDQIQKYVRMKNGKLTEHFDRGD